MTGSSNFDLMPARYVAGLIGGPVGAFIGTLDGAARKARRLFDRSPPAAPFEGAIAIMARRRS